MIHGLRLVHCVNMQRLREKIKMMSVNQMAVYDMIMEVFNIIHNSSSEQIQNTYIHQERRSLRKNANNFVRVPEKPMKRCTSFTYCGAKVFNNLCTQCSCMYLMTSEKPKTGLDMEGNSILLDKNPMIYLFRLFIHLFTL